MIRVAVLGASGHVGGTLFHRLSANPKYDVRPIVHSSGNAWSLNRTNIPLHFADLESRDSIRGAIEGCTHIANCTFPPPDRMAQTMDNLLAECLAAGVERLVHLSSVAVYGTRPTLDAAHESARTRTRRGKYGRYKLEQDRRIKAACDKGLPAVILCPPNLSGPGSRFLLSVLECMRRGALPLVESGRMPCELADVDNLTTAMEAALHCEIATGERIFVTDDQPTCWADVVAELLPLVGTQEAPASVSADDANFVATNGNALSLAKCAGEIIQIHEVRQVLKQNAFARRVYENWLPMGVRAWKSVPRLPGRARRRRSPANGASSRDRLAAYDQNFCDQQLRGVRHSCERAHTILGYEPPVKFRDSMQNFRDWYGQLSGWGYPEWDLLRELYPSPEFRAQA